MVAASPGIRVESATAGMMRQEMITPALFHSAPSFSYDITKYPADTLLVFTETVVL
jgi:hypothetical protein